MTHWYQPHHFQQVSISTTDTSALPPLSVVLLDHLSAVHAVGADSLTYLQGQLTCDLLALDKLESTLAAHCDSKGKVWAVLRVFHHLDGIGYVLPKSAVESQLTEMKKYAVFSKVDFVEEQVVLGVAGEKADNAMFARFTGKGNVRQSQTGSAVRIEPNRWLLVIDKEEALRFIDDLGNRADLFSHHLWQYLELKAGIPSIEAATSSEFIPQSLNLQHINAISFKKGCYTGQETVARAKYRGTNKRAAYLLQGDVDKGCTQAPKAGDKFERSIGDNWRTGGTVLSGFLFSDNKAIAMVVLPNDLEADTKFRRKDGKNLWQKTPLPYSLDEE